MPTRSDFIAWQVLQWVQESGCGVVLDSLTDLPTNLCERVRRCVPSVAHQAAANRAVFETRDLVLKLTDTFAGRQPGSPVSPTSPDCENQKGKNDARSVIACEPGGLQMASAPSVRHR